MVRRIYVCNKSTESEIAIRADKKIEALEQTARDLARSVEMVRQQTLSRSNERIEALEQKARDLAWYVETTRQQTLLLSDKKTLINRHVLDGCTMDFLGGLVGAVIGAVIAVTGVLIWMGIHHLARWLWAKIFRQDRVDEPPGMDEASGSGTS